MTSRNNHLQNSQFKEISQTTLHQTKWISFKTISYVDKNGIERKWDMCDRATTTGTVDAVDILAVFKKKGEEDRLVIELQYRPPLKRLCVEFPAGLVDKGETPIQAALREVKEETGYVGKVIHTDGLSLAYEPGLTSSVFNFIHMEIDGDSPENQTPQPHLEDGELIEVYLLSKKNLYDELVKLATEREAYIDGKLATFAHAIKLMQQ